MSAKAKPLDRVQKAVDSERLSASLLEVLDELGGEEARELAERLSEFADAVDAAKETLEEWTYSEDREERADAKERAIDALDELTSTTILIPDAVLVILPNLHELDDALDG